MNVRPKFVAPPSLSQPVRERMEQKAASQWCYVTTDQRAFYVSQTQAENMRATNGGTVYPPAQS